jgi:glycosyltransferase involved in cell wall biosynthesis
MSARQHEAAAQALTIGISPVSDRTLLVIAAEPGVRSAAEIAAETRPRPDYLLLRDALGASLLLPAEARTGLVGRLVGRRALPLALAWAAFRRQRRFHAIFSDSERIGLPLALLLATRGRNRARHIMLTHYLSPLKKRLWFRLGAAHGIDRLIAHSTAQRALAIERLGMDPARVVMLPYQVDTRFWRPQETAMDPSASPFICSAGLEFRDYPTLVRAVEGLDVRVRIAAASHWSHHAAFAGAVHLPLNITVASLNYVGLRQLYAEARFVVVPLLAVDNQAGITTILEAMAMGKAVVVSATQGQRDVVRGYPLDGRLVWQPAFLDLPDVNAALGNLPTGIYVAPANVDDLRRAITFLLEHPEVAEELGANGRRVAEAVFTVDAFARRVAATIRAIQQS